MTTVIYHNPRCSKSRQALQLLQDQGIEPEQRLYLDNPPDAKELRALLQQLGLGARDLLRTGEEDYKRLSLSDNTLSEDALLEAMSAHPKLIQRPVVIHQGRAVIGRPPENVLELLA